MSRVASKDRSFKANILLAEDNLLVLESFNFLINKIRNEYIKAKDLLAE